MAIHTPFLASWVKRLGQWHVYDSQLGYCRCGMQCLGNNFNKDIAPEDRNKCEECWSTIKPEDKVLP